MQHQADDIADEASDEESKKKDDSGNLSKGLPHQGWKKKKPAAAPSKMKSSKSAK
jgi:hypothetical protein